MTKSKFAAGGHTMVLLSRGRSFEVVFHCFFAPGQALGTRDKKVVVALVFPLSTPFVPPLFRGSYRFCC